MSSHDEDEGSCVVCKGEVGGNDSCYDCDICEQHIHKACSGLSASEVKCMPLQKRQLLFVCEGCKLLMRKLPRLVSLMDDMRNDLRELKIRMEDAAGRSDALERQRVNHQSGVGDFSQHSQVTDNVVGSYADVLKTKPEAVMIVKPKSQQLSSVTKRDIRQKVDPLEISVSKFRQVSKGGVVIGCDNEDETEKLKNEITEKLGDKYEVVVPKLKKPKLRIVNVNSDDISPEDSDGHIVDLVTRCNAINRGDDFHMKILKTSVNKFKNVDIVLETDPGTHCALLQLTKIKIGWSRCPVFNHLGILRCYNCLGYNHFAKDCKQDKACSACSGNHAHKDCDSQVQKCINCERLKRSRKMNIDSGHSAFDRACPVYTRLVKTLSGRVKYQCES